MTYIFVLLNFSFRGNGILWLISAQASEPLGCSTKLFLYAYCSTGVWHAFDSNLKQQSQKPISHYCFSYSCLILPHRLSLSRNPGNLLFYFQRVTAQMATSSVVLLKPDPIGVYICMCVFSIWMTIIAAESSTKHTEL